MFKRLAAAVARATSQRSHYISHVPSRIRQTSHSTYHNFSQPDSLLPALAASVARGSSRGARFGKCSSGSGSSYAPIQLRRSCTKVTATLRFTQLLSHAKKPGSVHSCPAGTRASLMTIGGGGSTAGSPGAVQAQLAIRKARWLALPVGTVAGVFGSLVGVGGGVVIVPLIVNACRAIPQRLVTGTSLVAVVSTAMASTATYWQGGLVDATAALVISPVAMLAAPLGARYTAKLDCTALRRALGYFLLLVAPLVPLKVLLLEHSTQQAQQAAQLAEQGERQAQRATSQQAQPAVPVVQVAPHAPPLPPSRQSSLQDAGAGTAGAACTASATAAGSAGQLTMTAGEGASEGGRLTLETCGRFLTQQAGMAAALPPSTLTALCATGAVAGFASGLLGIGGGTIVTPLLALVMPYGQTTVIGTSLLSMVPPSLAALLQHQRLGNVDWRMAAGLALGTAVGGTAGSTVAVQAPAGVLEGVFMLGMLLLGRKTLASAKR